jgi:hypothetical protein
LPLQATSKSLLRCIDAQLLGSFHHNAGIAAFFQVLDTLSAKKEFPIIAVNKVFSLVTLLQGQICQDF